MTQPFLIRFAKPCLSPNRVSPNSNYLYDEDIDMVRWLGSSDRLPVIEAYLLSAGPDDPPKTKKFAKCQREGIEFSGVIYGHQLRVTIGLCIHDLEIIAKSGETEDLKNQVVFLPL